MWASHSRDSLRQTTIYGVDKTFTSVSPLRVYSNSSFFYFGLDTLRTEHFEGLKHIPHRSAQSCNAERFLCSCSWSARHFIGRYRRQSSAKRRTCEETVEGRSLYRSKRVGVREQYPGAHRISRELILKSCHQLLLFGFYWSENFPEFHSGQVCARGVGGGQRQRLY